METWIKRGLWLLPWMTLTYGIRFKIGPLPTTLLELYVLGLIAVWVGWWLSRGQLVAMVKASAQRSGSWSILIHVWMAATLVAVFVSPSWWTGLGLWRAYVLEPVLVSMVAFVTLREREDWKRLWQSAYLTLPFLMLVGLGQFVTGWGIPHPWNVSIAAGRRATSVFRYPNAFSLYMVPIAAMAMAELVPLVRRRSWKEAILPAVAVLSAWIGLGLARSEGGMLGLLAASWVVLMTVRAWRPVILAGTLLVAAVGALFEPLRTVIVREVTFQGWSGRVRMWMWQDTWKMLKDHWLFGAGFGGYPVVFAKYHSKPFIEIFQYPHTILFNFWSETGLLGVATMMYLMGKWLVAGIRIWKKEGLLVLAPLIAILVQGLVDVPYFKNDLAIYFWLFVVFAMWMSLPRMDRKMEASRSDVDPREKGR